MSQKMADVIADVDEQKPHLCVLVAGMHKGYPTVAQLNSFSDFEPKYLWTKDAPKFSTILYGDDSTGGHPTKNEIFKEATEYMELKAKGRELSPGLAAEILTRGIYKKADDEQRAFGKKYAGGVVNAAVVTARGPYTLSGFQILGG